MIRHISILLAACLFAGPSFAQTGTDRLKADLLAARSATQVLGQWCAARHLADPPVIHAVRDPVDVAPSTEVRALLHVSADQTVRYRRVRLTCGGHVLSEADNWYVPARLTSAMNNRLDTSDTPFGKAVKALNFHRRTLDTRPGPAPGTVLRIRAVLLTPDETPFSLVVENYTNALVSH